MAQDDQSAVSPPPPLVRAASPVSRYLMLGGVAGACFLGVAAGIWARPASNERHVVHPAQQALAPAAPVEHQLQIVVDDSPAPVGAPLEVLPGAAGQNQPAAAPVPVPVPAPINPTAGVAAGLMRVDTPQPAPQLPELAPARVAPPPVAQVLAPAPQPLKLLARPAPHIDSQQVARAEAHAKALQQAKAAETARVAQAQADQRREKLVLAARAAADRKGARLAEIAHSVKLKAQTLAKAEATKLRLAEAKAEQARLAHARAAQEAHRQEMARAAQAAYRQELARQDAAERKAKAVQLARADARHRAQAEQLRETRLAEARKAEILRLARSRNGGLLRLAKANRCASSDPGAALVCADAGLGAADRRMNQAYQEAAAAGVPAWRLQSQHQRWLAARSAAAREAPWAVQDVYQERIAELHDQARNPGGY